MSPQKVRTSLMIFLLVFAFAKAEGQSCCSSKEKITLCYLSAADYCFSNNGRCHEYSLDGENMNQSLAVKLASSDNFGANGVVDCEFDFKQLGTINNIQSINDCDCDIVFLPAVFVDTVTNQVNNNLSFMPGAVLQTVREWSVDCPSNLVIASQGESRNWGYELANANQNPNSPVAGTVFGSIFDGPFGSINSFEQGGSYQGVFTQIPTTGAEVLATDSRGRPTIVYDEATGDLIAGDIGIFCNGPGDVTVGSQVTTNNDILVCNIFALACRLAESTRFTTQIFETCENETIVLPSGEMTDILGVYIDTLTSFNGCDSIIRTELIDCEIIEMPNIFSPNGDGINDFFNLQGSKKVAISNFKIYNRWGQMVYDNDTPETGWDGTFEGERAVSDVYIYRIVFRNLLGTREEILTGDVTLYR